MHQGCRVLVARKVSKGVLYSKWKSFLCLLYLAVAKTELDFLMQSRSVYTWATATNQQHAARVKDSFFFCVVTEWFIRLCWSGKSIWPSRLVISSLLLSYCLSASRSHRSTSFLKLLLPFHFFFLIFIFTSFNGTVGWVAFKVVFHPVSFTHLLADSSSTGTGVFLPLSVSLYH